MLEPGTIIKIVFPGHFADGLTGTVSHVVPSGALVNFTDGNRLINLFVVSSKLIGSPDYNPNITPGQFTALVDAVNAQFSGS